MFFPELKKQLSKKQVTGFRTDIASSYGVWRFGTLSAVLRYETEELGNKDIYYTLKQRGVSLDLRRKNKGLMEQVLCLMQVLFQCKREQLFCLWLCDTLEEAMAYIPEYCRSANVADIFECALGYYQIQEAVMLSDLAYEGHLYVFKQGTPIQYTEVNTSNYRDFLLLDKGQK